MSEYNEIEGLSVLGLGVDSPCPACGQPIDCCQGHGEIGDPEGYLTLELHDNGVHTNCHPNCDTKEN